MNQLIDPRPVEPPIYGEHLPVDRIEWTISRNNGRAEKTLEYGSGNAVEFYKKLILILSSSEPECLISVDATLIDPDNVSVSLSLANTSCPDVYWVIDPVAGAKEEGLDPFELFDWVNFCLEKQAKFSIDLSWYDPTP